MHPDLSDSIRPLSSDPDRRECVELQRLVWGFGQADLVSGPMLEHSVNRGGILLGYRHPGGLLAGFVYSFPAPLADSVIQHSHMLAVRPECRDEGIGNALKWAQYWQARDFGNPLVTWTFDPLEARNAHLNLNKLGVRVRRYYVNLYGQATTSPLHSGLGTDRLLAEWHVLKTPLRSIAGKVKSEAVPVSTRALDSEPSRTAPHRSPLEPRLSLDLPRIAVETPTQTQLMKQVDLPLALRWRNATRAALTHYLGRGYVICGLWVLEEDPIRTFYCLADPGSIDVFSAETGEACS